jgi:uncharacterized membrane protein
MFELPPHLHPMVVHFPIALFLTALGLDVFSFIFKKESLHRSALTLYVLATLLTPVVVRTGIWEAVKLGLKHPLLDQHRQYATWLMWFSLMSLPVLWLVKKEFSKYFRLIFIVTLIGASVLVSVAADKGGRMVYEYGVGIEE